MRGDVALNGQRLRIDPLRVRYEEQVLTIEALTLIDPSGRGSLTAAGDVRFGAAAAAAANTAEAAPPFYANLQVQWKDVELPKEWVGQPLATHGELKVIGSPATFTADGKLALGPPGKLADIALDVAGTPEQIQVKQFAIVQKGGNLTATGTVRLKPQIDWQLDGESQRASTPARSSPAGPAASASRSTRKASCTEQGPSASLDLKNLDGHAARPRARGPGGAHRSTRRKSSPAI